MSPAEAGADLEVRDAGEDVGEDVGETAAGEAEGRERDVPEAVERGAGRRQAGRREAARRTGKVPRRAKGGGGPSRLAVAPPAESPHAPRRGWVARILGPLHVTGVFWYRFHAFGARLPDGLIRVLMPLFIAFFFLSLRNIRGSLAANLEAVLGPCGGWERQRRIWRTFRDIAWSQTERYQRLVGNQDFAVETEGDERWRRLAASPQGAVLVTGHIGNWEMASTLPSSREGKRIHVVREEELDRRAQTFIEERLRRRVGDGYVTHFAADHDPRLGLALREALDRGELVFLQGDRPRRGGSVLPVTLFGRPYAVPAGPLALARQTGVALLPVFVFRVGLRRYRVRFGAEIRVERGGDRPAEMAAAARALAAELEAAIRFRPHQWFVFRELW